MARRLSALCLALVALAAVCAAQNSNVCCGQRTFQLSTNAYVPVPIDQYTIFVRAEAQSGLNDSFIAVRNAVAIVAQVNEVLNSTRYTNITNIQETGITVNTRTNFTCPPNSGCFSFDIGYSAVATISFNIPLSEVNDIVTDLLSRSRGISIQNQQAFIPPEIFGAAQTLAIRRALENAQFRAEQVVPALKGVKLGLPLRVSTTSYDNLQFGGSANGAVYGQADVTFEILPN